MRIHMYIFKANTIAIIKILQITLPWLGQARCVILMCIIYLIGHALYSLYFFIHVVLSTLFLYAFYMNESLQFSFRMYQVDL